INAGNGVLTWKPSSSQMGTNILSVVVTDNGSPALSATQSFAGIVLASNSPPTLAPIPSQTLYALATLLLTNSATDPDLPGQSLTYSLGAATPAGVTIGATNGVLAWTPADSQVGTANMTVCVTDNGLPPLSQTQTFTVSVLPRPEATIRTSAGVVSLTWSAIAGTTYRVQSKTNLDPVTWTDLSPEVVASGSTASLTDAAAGTNVTRFYRVQVIQ
ncbi:MAG TPA: cadherin repeat domain-containing protein, partial [Candidatus Sulfotelmatobacter sp.]|nr:cadherin repeat domain-containing protein [Candidatus Sulfotelmatobacter sp.]